jgi:Flp pilus assembly CpaE family ATPase
MELEDYTKNIKLNKINTSVNEQISEMLELFTDISNLECSSYYRYNYEYNDFFYNYTITKDGEKIDEPKYTSKSYKLFLKKNKIVYGYIKINKRLISNKLLTKILSKLKNHLEQVRELEKKLLGSDLSFNIFLFHDNDLEVFGENLKSGLEGLFNVDVTMDNDMEKHLPALNNKDKKHIIIYLVSDEKSINKYENIIKSLNELIVIIGPNNHHLSMYCGKLGIQNYIPITEFKAEDLKQIIVDTRNNLFNKNKYGNKIIALSGVSGGIGTTTISMNMSDLLSQNLPDKNILYIDLSTTKAISNLFLEQNPLPGKTIIDLVNSSEFHLENNLENGLTKKRENFYCVTGIQKHIDKELLEQDIFIEKLLEYISSASDYFNFIVIDVGISDASNLKSTIYDIVNELWLVTEMNLPHISKVKTFYSLMKRAGLKDKISFIVNRYDSQNAISVNDVSSILNMNSDNEIKFDEYKIPNDYQTLGKCWNLCELASTKNQDSIFVKKLNTILIKKDFYKGENSKSPSWFSSLFKKAHK